MTNENETIGIIQHKLDELMPMMARFYQESEEQAMSRINRAYHLLKIGYPRLAIMAETGLNYEFLRLLYCGNIEGFDRVTEGLDSNDIAFDGEDKRTKKFMEKVLAEVNRQIGEWNANN